MFLRKDEDVTGHYFVHMGGGEDILDIKEVFNENLVKIGIDRSTEALYPRLSSV